MCTNTEIDRKARLVWASVPNGIEEMIAVELLIRDRLEPAQNTVHAW